MMWTLSHRADRRAAALADRHYTRQTVGSAQFVPPGRCLVLLTPDADALWVTSWPDARYVKHAWAGAWMCSLFRNEAPDRYLSSALIRDAVAATRACFGKPPALGMVTFVDPSHVRTKRDPGRCYRRAGFRPVGFTKSGLVALQLLPADMPQQAIASGMSLNAFRDISCPICGKLFQQSERGRKRLYCGDTCRQVACRRRSASLEMEVCQ